MLPLLTRSQMAALDRLTIDDIGIPALVLMEVAGRCVADAAERCFHEDGRPVVALAGTGNNGADAVVAARHLAERGIPASVAVIGAKEKLTAEAAAQVGIAERLEVPMIFVEQDVSTPAFEAALAACGTVVDGLFGTGLSRPVEGLYRDVILRLGALEGRSVVAVDIASGVDGDTGQILGVAVAADVTVTFQYPKIGHALYPGRGLTGELSVADIGIPPSQVGRVAPMCGIVSTARLREAFVDRSADSHKGTYGHLLVVAGAPERPGSALLAGRGALRTGAGLVTIGSDRETIARLAPAFEALMGMSLGHHRPEPDAIIEALATRTALAIGPSLAPDARTLAMLQAVLAASRVPAVLDAGALAAMGPQIEWLKERSAPTVLTPHPGEMGRLLGIDTAAVQRDRLRSARAAAERTGAHVVLKGASTVVAHPDGRAGVIVAGNPGMSTGGTGDVLTGVIGALLAQGVAADVAAEAGALLHAMAGDRAAQVRGEVGLTAPDLLLPLTELVRERVEQVEAVD